jgi:hypothetical protein
MKDAKMETTIIPAKHAKTKKPWDRKRNTDEINKKFWQDDIWCNACGGWHKPPDCGLR